MSGGGKHCFGLFAWKGGGWEADTRAVMPNPPQQHGLSGRHDLGVTKPAPPKVHLGRGCNPHPLFCKGLVRTFWQKCSLQGYLSRPSRVRVFFFLGLFGTSSTEKGFLCNRRACVTTSSPTPPTVSLHPTSDPLRTTKHSWWGRQSIPPWPGQCLNGRAGLVNSGGGGGRRPWLVGYPTVRRKAESSARQVMQRRCSE